MTDEDIAAMFAYVKTFEPVHHYVDNSEPPTFCKVCRQTHGRKPELGVAGIENGTLPTPVEWSANSK